MSATAPRSQHSRLLLAAATAAVLAVTVAPAHAEDGATHSVDLTDATLDWGVKESFRSYVEGPIAGGETTVGDGAVRHEDGTFGFVDGTGTYDPDSHAVDAAFDGSVHFSGHGGDLDLELSALRMTTEGADRGSVVADVTVSGETTQDVEFADLDLSAAEPESGEDGTVTLAEIPASLTGAGSEAFVNPLSGQPMYDEGEELDAVSLTVAVAADDDSDGSSDPDDSDDSSDSDGSDDADNPARPSDPTDPSNPAGPDDAPDATSGTVLDGTLDWGVKESFRQYITGPVADGDVELTGGADENPDGTYRFPGGTGEFDTDAGQLTTGFDGAVRLTGHADGDGGHALDLSFSAFAVEVDGDESLLIADVSAQTLDGERVEYEAAPVASLDVPADALVPEDDLILLNDVDAVLTDEGADAFGGFYEPGDELDPVTAALAVGDAADLPGPGGDGGGDGNGPAPSTGGASGGASGASGGAGGALAATGVNSAGLLGAAAALTAAGGAAFWTARRRVSPTAG